MEDLNNINILEQKQKDLKENEIMLIKFTAEWCAPCKGIKPLCDFYTSKLPNNIFFYEIDIDDSIEIFTFLKTKKMLKGVPAILAYYGGNKETFYIPDDSVLNGNKIEVENFFKRVLSLN